MTSYRVLAAIIVTCTRSVLAQLPDSVVVRSAAALSEFEQACGDRAAVLWSESLCGPLVLVDPSSRAAVASRRPPSGTFVARHGVHVGLLPPEIEVANTAIDWLSERWTMVMLPLSQDQFDRIRLLFHEAFHRIQPALGIPAVNVVISELEERDARYWLRLELRALGATQRHSGDAAAREAASDALLFRAIRHRQYPGIDTLEAALELSEGLAEYTGMAVAASLLRVTRDSAAELARITLEGRPTFARSYGYGAGPPLGFALDRFAPGWRDRVATIPSLASELARAIEWVPPADLRKRAEARAVAYAGPLIAREEDRRAEARDAQVAGYRETLINGPVMVLRQRNLSGAFNPNTIVPLGSAGLVYPRRNVVAEWGELAVRSGGLLVAHDRAAAFVPARGLRIDTTGRHATGDGWELKLNRGWRIERGAREGDFEIVQVAERRDQKPYAAVALFIGAIEEGARIFPPARLLPLVEKGSGRGLGAARLLILPSGPASDPFAQPGAPVR